MTGHVHPVPRFGQPLVRLGVVGSTNDLARLLAAGGVREGAVVVAAQQTHGRGRLGRPWASPPGGLWCSVIVRPDGDAGWGLLSLAAAVAVAETVERAAAARAAIRWPNDVIIAGAKVAGILIETAPGAAILGIGLNANNDPAALPAGVRTPATSLSVVLGQPVALDPLLELLLEQLATWYAAWARSDPAVVTAWSARDATRGTAVVVQGPDGAIGGVAEGVDSDGALLVRTARGEVQRVLAGDLEPAAPPAGTLPQASKPQHP
jgi:BirA family biotin operon repressor/biotin-[acetyl-CoA-carboxylase] ligase